MAVEAIFDQYPMTIDQMKQWAERMTQLDPNECAVALRILARWQPDGLQG